MDTEQLTEQVERLTRIVDDLKRELARHNHPYTKHAREHEARDASPFLRVPIYSSRPPYTPNGRLYYRSDNNTLEIQVNGTIMASGTFT